jgi:hypothetical protein
MRQHTTDDAGLSPSAGERDVLRFAALDETEVVVTDVRLMVLVRGRIRLDCRHAAIRRIQLDVEQTLPATFVVVPANPIDEAQLVRIPDDALELAARTVAFIGVRL